MNALHLRMVRVALAVAVLAALAAGRMSAQAPAAAPPDYSKVEIQSTQLAPNFYRFEAVGPVLVGNAGAFIGPDGVFLVDAMFTQLNDKQAAYIGVSTEGPFKPDHYRY